MNESCYTEDRQPVIGTILGAFGSFRRLWCKGIQTLAAVIEHAGVELKSISNSQWDLGPGHL